MITSIKKNSNRGLDVTSHSYQRTIIIIMWAQLVFAFTLVTATTSARDVRVLDDTLVYRYVDAVQKCAEQGLELAWHKVIKAKLEEGGSIQPDACGWTEDVRYATYLARVSTENPDNLEECSSVSASGISSSGAIVYCQTDTSLVDATNPYNYNVVFVPEDENGSPILVNNMNPAKDVCEGLGAKLAYKTKLHLYRGFRYNDCAWVREVRGVYKAGYPVAEGYTLCTRDSSIDYPIYCLGKPPLPSINECATNNGLCEQVCVDTDPGYHCDCNPGYTTDTTDPSRCVDVDECAASNPCSDNEACDNTPGAFLCDCVSGYTKNGAGVCVADVTADPCDGIGPAELNGVPVECRNGMILVQFNAPCNTAGRESFNRLWAEYENGFGNALTGYWAGLRFLHQTTAQAPYKLVIEVEVDGGKYFAQYDNFVVGPDTDKYRLSVGAYSVPAGQTGAGDALNQLHYDNIGKDNGSQFSTPDQDNDRYEDSAWPLGYGGSCAKMYDAGWWFNNCHRGLLNGVCSDDPRYWSDMSSAKQWHNVAWRTKEIEQTWMMIYTQ